MMRLACEGRPLRVVNDQVCTPTSTQELARRLFPLIHDDRKGLFHMTNTGGCSWYEFARKIFELAGVTATITPCGTQEYGAKAARPAYSVLDNLAYRTAGYEDFTPWQEALATYLRERKSGG